MALSRLLGCLLVKVSIQTAPFASSIVSSYDRFLDVKRQQLNKLNTSLYEKMTCLCTPTYLHIALVQQEGCVHLRVMDSTQKQNEQHTNSNTSILKGPQYLRFYGIEDPQRPSGARVDGDAVRDARWVDQVGLVTTTHGQL